LCGEKNCTIIGRTFVGSKYKDKATKLEIQIFKVERWNMEEKIKEMQKIMQ
jgi:hypothetical protein